MLTVDLSRGVVAKSYVELCKMPRVRLIGDIAFYYLTYVEAIAARNPNVRFLCLRRDIDETVASWMSKSAIARWPSKYLADRLSSWITREPFYESCNFWMQHDGTHWQLDPVWDKCFPKFEAMSKPDAIRKYCEYYYEEADRVARRLGSVFRFAEAERLNERSYQAGILDFLGIPTEEHQFTHAHIHQSKAPKTGRPAAYGLVERANS